MEINDVLLQDLLKYAKIDDIDRALAYIEMSKKLEKVQKIHPYAITPPTKEGGRYQTCYKGINGKRKNIKAPTEKELWEKLIPIYFPQSNLDKFKFSDLFQEWLTYKESITSSPNTIMRHRQHYRRYFEKSALHDKNIARIDDLFLETECNRIVKSFNLTRKEWNNVKTILNGMFDYATRKHYLQTDPMEKVRIFVKFRQVVKKSGSTQTYNTQELQDLHLYLDRMFAETGDSVFLCIKFNFLAGLRVGELVSLRWSDIEGNRLHIVREEVRNQTTNSYEVVEHTKTYQDRFVILVPKALEILHKIPRESEYIFTRDSQRIVSRQVAKIIKKYAQSQGMEVKSSHKIRKTFASLLNANGVPIDCIREMLGHNNLSTTLGYIYNPLTESETYELIKNAL